MTHLDHPKLTHPGFSKVPPLHPWDGAVVMGRGIERKRIFLNNKDRDDFINRLSDLVKEGAIDIYAWALMPNHFHLFMTKKNLRISGQRIDLEELCNRVCKKKNVSLAELISGSRRRELVNARRIVSWIAVNELGYSGAEVARHLGVTNSCVTRFLSSGEKPAIEGVI